MQVTRKIIRGLVFMSMFSTHREKLCSRRFEKNEEAKIRQKKGRVRGRKKGRESTKRTRKQHDQIWRRKEFVH